MNCKKCGIQRERGIQDKIPLCHLCYLEIAEAGKNPEMEVSEIVIRWSAEDVKTLRPGLSDEEAGEILDRVSRPLMERSIEEGWEILEILINIIERESKGEAVNA